MKATGKYYILLLVSASLVVLGSALITTWTSDSTSELRLWMDPLLFGFGAAGVSTALLIVSNFPTLPATLPFLLFQLEANHPAALSEGYDLLCGQ